MRLVSRVVTAAAIAVATIVLSSASLGAPSAADIETARDQFNAGLELRDKGDLRGAMTRLRIADKLVHTPITALEVGRTHLMLGELVEGVEALLSVARIPVAAGESENAKAARKEAAALAEQTAPRIPSLHVAISAAPSGLRVTIDGVEVPADTLVAPRKLDPGRHAIVVSAPGYVTSRSEVTLAEKETRTVNVTLTPTTSAPSSVDGGAPAKAGAPVLAYVGFGVAGAGLLVGGVTGVMTLGKAARVRDECPGGACTTEEGRADLRDGRTLGTVSTISFAVAGVGAVVGTLSLVLRADERPAKVVELRPWVGLGSVGLSGAF